MHQSNHIEKKEDYFIGGLVGDTHNDEDFKNKIERLCEKLRNKYGLINYVYCWSPLQCKGNQTANSRAEVSDRSKKSENRTKKKISAIKI